ncbi:NAD(P)/FAD-dependent oxidoreductase [Chelatococcus sp. GCM10030263]|uniref:NAD(P)/FAD-dependent oxidoreductase n=1 Tax=Chelatococcus sp. GCM10030263 TaxID=3273387 RepID=UPI00361A9358
MSRPCDAPSPLWAALSRESFTAAPLDGACDIDVAVIGGGIAGLSTALHLARAGIATVVVEAGEIGAGASGRNNGQVIPTLTRHDPDAILKALGPDYGPRFLDLVKGSADTLYETVARYGIDCDAVRNGWIQPAHTPGRARLAAHRAAQWQAQGVAAVALSADDIAARLGTTAYHGGWFHPGGGHINPLAFTRGLARAAAQEGARIHADTPATALARRPDGWHITTPRGTVRAEKVVLATAAYSGALWPAMARSIVPVLSYQVATEPLGSDGASILSGNEAASDTRMDLRYFRRDREGRIVSGGALALQVLGQQRVTRLVLERLRVTFPQVGLMQAQYVWSGRIAMTPERLPRLHRRDDGLLAWIGCNGRGLALAMAMGQVMADAVRGAPATDLPLPLTEPKGIPLSPLVNRTARLILPYYRMKDRREVSA